MTLAAGVVQFESRRLADACRASAVNRVVGAYLIFVASGLAVAWLSMWAAYVFAGVPTHVDPDAFKVVATLDLSMMVPFLAAGGALLWQRRPQGYLVATVASIQSALNLLVLSVNSCIAISRDLAVAPGELPIWLPLALLTTTAAIILLIGASHHSSTRRYL
jgi:hypothetical protein